MAVVMVPGGADGDCGDGDGGGDGDGDGGARGMVVASGGFRN